MKKMTKTNSEKLFKAVKNKIEGSETVEYKLGDNIFEIKVHTDISIFDIENMARSAAVAMYDGGETNLVLRDCLIAQQVIEYLTDLPVPMLKTENGEELVNIPLCYEIVFGHDGLIALCNKLDDLIYQKIVPYAAAYVKNEKENNDPQRAVFNRAGELIDLFMRVAEDIADNPAATLDLVEAVQDSEATEAE